MFTVTMDWQCEQLAGQEACVLKLDLKPPIPATAL